MGQWESKAPDCEKAAECPSHQNRPISAYTAGCTARMFCRSITYKLIQIESQKEQTRWSSAEVFASTAVKLRAETNLCAGCACIPHQVFQMSIILSVYTKTPKDTIVHGYPKIGTPTDDHFNSFSRKPGNPDCGHLGRVKWGRLGRLPQQLLRR